MSKSIQAVTLPDASSKIREDASAHQNRDKDGEQFFELLAGKNADTRPLSQEQGKAADTAGTEPLPPAATANETDAQEMTALDAVQQQLAQKDSPENLLVQSVGSVKPDTSSQVAKVPEALQLSLPGVQEEKLTAGDEILATQNDATVQQGAADGVGLAEFAGRPALAEFAGRPALAEFAGEAVQRPALAEANARLQAKPVLLPDPSGANAARPVLTTPAPTPASGITSEQQLPDAVTVTARGAQYAIAAALSGKAGTAGFLPDGRNAASQKSSVITPGATVDVGTSEFASSLPEIDVKPLSVRIAAPVGQPGWGRAVGEQVVWFVSQNISAANLRLNPQHLGPLEMQVSLDGNQANVAFTSHSAQVRDALESALPRLREMLAENGLNLANVNVSQHNSPEQRNQGESRSRQAGDDTPATGNGLEGDAASAPRPSATTLLGLVDTYA